MLDGHFLYNIELDRRFKQPHYFRAVVCLAQRPHQFHGDGLGGHVAGLQYAGQLAHGAPHLVNGKVADAVPHTEPQRGASERNRRLRRLLARRSAGAVLEPLGGDCAVLP